MKSITICASLAFLLLLPLVASASSEVRWEYEGHFGPENWANFHVDFAACETGAQQSPIDFVEMFESDLAPITLNWKSKGWMIENVGHTLKLFSEDPGTAIIEGIEYRLVEVHFHTPSEHSFDGTRNDMEAHFVHHGPQDEIAVIGVLMRGGGRHDQFESILAKAPLEPHIREDVGDIDLMDFITDIGDIVRYQGSLTTPPCTEKVTWTVLSDPLTISDTAIMAFGAMFNMNARPIQPANRRYVITD